MKNDKERVRYVYVIRRLNEDGEVETYCGGWRAGKLTPKTGAWWRTTAGSAATYLDDGEYTVAIRMRIRKKTREKLSEIFEAQAVGAIDLNARDAYSKCARIARERDQ